MSKINELAIITAMGTVFSNDLMNSDWLKLYDKIDKCSDENLSEKMDELVLFPCKEFEDLHPLDLFTEVQTIRDDYLINARHILGLAEVGLVRMAIDDQLNTDANEWHLESAINYQGTIEIQATAMVSHEDGYISLDSQDLIPLPEHYWITVRIDHNNDLVDIIDEVDEVSPLNLTDEITALEEKYPTATVTYD